MRNRPFRVGDRVERRVFKRDDPEANRGKIVAIGIDFSKSRAAVIRWDDGSEQMCDRRDLRRSR